MKKHRIISRFSLISLLFVSSLLLTTACSIPTQDETEMLEELLNRLDAVEGEITFTTKDGETVNIQITKESSQLIGESDSNVVNNEKKEVNTDKPANILPVISSKEDVFKLLGVLDQALELRKKGLSWSSTATELGYTPDSMFSQLEEFGESELKEALESGLINLEQMQKKLSEFTMTAGKWVEKIFADSIVGTAGSLSDYLPVLDSIEDVFKTLGVWDKAHSLHEQGLAWFHVASELGYTADSMYTALTAKIETMLKEAYSAGLLRQEKMEYKRNIYSDTSLKWINKIFSDVSSNASVSISDILPTLESYEDVFKLLGVWEKASTLHEEGLSWSSITIELGYSQESMYKKIRGIAEEELHDAKINGLINYEQYKVMLEHYCISVESWVKEVFSDPGIPSVTS